jgi:high-affinity iron transporter
MFAITRIVRPALIAWVALLACAAPAASSPEVVPAAQTWQLLDYIAVDYANAVRDGAVVNAAEYAEMQEFAAAARSQLAQLPDRPSRARMVAAAQALQARIEARADAAAVAGDASALADEVLVAYGLSAGPAAAPDLARAAALYAQQCAACHGRNGAGDGPAAAGLDPPPIDFTDAQRAAQRSPFALYQVITQGLSGTSMAGYPQLSDADRWALAYHVGGLASPSNAAGLALARSLLDDSLSAYRAGDNARARRLALAAYLDGVEPVEPMLASRNRPLLQSLESALARFRQQIEGAVAVAELALQHERIAALFDQADAALSGSGNDVAAAFLSSFTILLREGLEALLIVIGMIAFLRKAQRRDVLPYVHAGWTGALLAGGLTWLVATYLIGISGASREITEGLSALFAAVVLLSVGIWMHQKSLAGRWQEYLKASMSAAMTRRSAWFVFLLAFVAVYREVFETILFFAAMWSEQNSNGILAGLAAGSVALALIAFWMLRISRTLPIARFFRLSSLLIAVLAVVLVGKGVAALQEAGWIAQSFVAGPRIDWIGVYPTWQSLLAQLAVAVLAWTAFSANARASRIQQRAHDPLQLQRTAMPMPPS